MSRRIWACAKARAGRSAARGAEAFAASLRHLAHHHPERAVEPLRSAVAACPPAAAALLERRLYWLAVALLRLDRLELALTSLAAAQRLRPRGRARAAYLRRANDYGMVRRPSRELDDFYAFWSLQVNRYLDRRPGGHFGSVAEKDLVTRTLALAWKRLCASGQLDGADTARRLALFSAVRPDYPVPVTPSRFAPSRSAAPERSPEPAACADILVVDFRRGVAVKASDKCPCGSGLPWCQCCGRTKSPRERER